ncbi:hypothetical protein Tco_0006096 [Tanacetum coccineum]
MYYGNLTSHILRMRVIIPEKTAQVKSIVAEVAEIDVAELLKKTRMAAKERIDEYKIKNDEAERSDSVYQDFMIVVCSINVAKPVPSSVLHVPLWLHSSPLEQSMLFELIRPLYQSLKAVWLVLLRSSDNSSISIKLCHSLVDPLQGGRCYLHHGLNNLIPSVGLWSSLGCLVAPAADLARSRIQERELF